MSGITLTQLKYEFSGDVAETAGNCIGAQCLRDIIEGGDAKDYKFAVLAGALVRLTKLPNADRAALGFARQLMGALDCALTIDD